MSNQERVSLEQAQDIVSKHEGRAVHVDSFVEVTSAGYRCEITDTILTRALNEEDSYTASMKTYHISLSEKSYLLLATPLDEKHQPPMSIPTLSNLLSKILSTTQVPVPKPVAQDTTSGEGRWDFGWLLLLAPPSGSSQRGTLASLRTKLSPSQLARLELRLGTYLRAFHNLENEWFGRPVDAPSVTPSLPSLFAVIQGGENGEADEDWTRYSWQDTFVLILEELLAEVFGENEDGKLRGDTEDVLDVNLEELRRYLSRALGSFLFDDVETPQLVWVTGSDEDIFVSFSDPSSSTGGLQENPDAIEEEVDIAYVLPSFTHALWGDPLMESFFVPPGPSQAISEGYFDDEDGRLIIFPRQRTKRVWYTVYLALIVLAEDRKSFGVEMKMYSGKVKWAKEILPKCVEILKDAPCY